ncbi:hypothetical protein U1Q18_038153, partial [Sarracenia purpurea var. burkii]
MPLDMGIFFLFPLLCTLLGHVGFLVPVRGYGSVILIERALPRFSIVPSMRPL